ncbi:MAG: glycosyltransferase family 2 protein [Bacteroidia bacterium]
MYKLSIIAPIFNESAIVMALHQRLKQVAIQLVGDDHEIIFVNDGSKDDSLEKLRLLAQQDKSFSYLSFTRNFGHQIAVTAGLDHVNGQAVVIIDGDLQDPPEVIPELYAKYQEGYKIVFAQRRSRAGETIFKKITAKWFYRTLASITSVDIPIDTGDFRLIDFAVVEQLRKMPEHSKFLRGQIAWTGFSQCPVLYDRQERVAGETGYTLKKMLRFALDGITSFSDLPLKLATYLGFSVAFFSFLVIIYALVSYFIFDRVVAGWTSMLISTMFIGGVQLLTIGIIGEYISRISTDVKNRPLYIVGERNH